MAASLLAGIDWTDLDSAEMTTAVRILCIAMQERFNIGAVELDGDFNTAGTVANPSDNVLKDMFPYKSNTPRWPLNDDDPLVDYTDSGSFAAQDNLVHLIQNAAQHYADIEKWNDAATDKDSGDTRFVLSGAADAPGTYDNRLLEVTGYTTYPDLTVMAPEEVKKLYDMVIVMKYVVRQTNLASAPTSYIIWDGEFSVNQTTTFSVDDPEGQGADYNNGGSSADVPDATTTPYTDLKTANSNLFSSPSSTFNENTDSGTYEPPWDTTNLGGVYNIYVKKAPGDYRAFIKCAQRTHVIDYDVIKTAIGATGLPLEWKSQTIFPDVLEVFPTGLDTNFVFPGTTTAENQRFWETITSSNVGDVATIYRDNLLQGVTLPTVHTSIPNNESIEVRVQERTSTITNNLLVSILEDWGGDGGFEYY